MTSVFNFIGGASDGIRKKLTTTAATVVAGSADATSIVWLQCNEMAGGTPLLTVEIYDGTTSYYLGANGVTYKAKALTALQSVLFDTGIVLLPNEYLRVTASVANQVDVIGLPLLNGPIGG